MSSQNGDDESYFMTAGGVELERLSLQHKAFRLQMGGLLYAPIDLSQPKLSILDSGTANGLWLRDLAECLQNPFEHDLVGTDIEVDWFPKSPPKGQIFQKQSIADEWPSEWAGKFDLVHQRLVLGCLGGSSVAKGISDISKVVKPGGYIEFTEADFEDMLDNGPAMRQLLSLISQVIASTGADCHFSKNLGIWLKDAGMEDIRTEHVDLKFGALNQCPDTKEMTSKALMLGAHAIITVAKSMNIEAGFSYHDLAKRLGHELRERGAAFRHRVVWGRKTTI